ncbi:hypothetical protein [Streptomyces sp. NPDC047000]|uniref:hypothetical protein n=1 Tax=Streptomyces sp. NPDC047000 TaxID=3155474 RepID=UPI003407B5B1
MDLSFYTSPISQEIRAEGAVLRAAADVLGVFDARHMEVPEAVRERILGCDDLDALRRWLRRAVIAPTADDVFAADDATDERSTPVDGLAGPEAEGR